jgi:large subunit ribosomal protein L17
MITLGKRGDLHARRRAMRVIRLRDVTAKVFDDLAERFKDRPGGYTRIIKADVRPGDAAAMSIVQLVEAGTPESWKAKAAIKAPKKKASKKKATTKKKSTTKKAAAKKDDAEASEAKTPAKKKAAPKKKKAAAKKKSD